MIKHLIIQQNIVQFKVVKVEYFLESVYPFTALVKAFGMWCLSWDGQSLSQ